VFGVSTTFYRMRLVGAAMQGTGVLVFQKATAADRGVIVGADVGGLFYDGEFREEAGQLIVNISIRIPRGAVLVTGAPPVPDDLSSDILNTAARLEEYAKQAGFDLVASGVVLDRLTLPSGVTATPCGDLALRGKAASVAAYGLGPASPR
jgi:hypothetical protein